VVGPRDLRSAPAALTDSSAPHDLRFLRLHLTDAPPQVRATTWREQPRAARDVQEQQRWRIYVVRRPDHDEIFPGVGSGLPQRPITWITNSNKGQANLSPVRHQRRDPTQRASEERLGLAQEAST
jgi:hypothetical protein